MLSPRQPRPRAVVKVASAIFAGAVAFGASQSHAVSVGPRGLGQALIFSYYTVRSDASGGGYNTLFLITNTTSDTKIIRVRFRESQNGREVAAVNLFLTPFDSWAAAVVPANPGARLVTFDQSCTQSNPTSAQGSIPFSGAGYSGVNSDNGDQTLDRTTEGFFEAIEMGVVQDQTVLAALNPMRANNFSVVPDCASALAVQLDNVTKVSAPTGGLMGSGFIVSVTDGTLYSYDGTSLENFSGVPIWSPVTSTGPTLQDVNPKVSDLVDSSGYRHSTWDVTRGAHPADPVSAVLMQEQVLNYFVLDTATNSQTDWVVTMPTKPFYTDSALTGSATAFPPFEEAFIDGGAPDYFGISPTTLIYPNQGDTTMYDREGRYPVGTISLGPNPPPPTLFLQRAANVVSFYPGNLLASSASVVIGALVSFQNGWARLVPFHYPNGPVHQLVSTDNPATTFFGLPMVGFMANSYVNGTLAGPSGPVLSNYGATSSHKGQIRVQ